MTSYAIRTYGDTVVARKLRAMADRAADLSPAWPEVVEIAARAYARSFREQGPGWADLRERTKKRKRNAVGFVYPIRKRTGRDEDTVTNPANLEFRGTAHALDIWPPDDTPAYMHQTGTIRMVARPLKVSRTFQDKMSRAIRDKLSEAYDHG
jgi:hypothetical protein